MRNFGRPKPRNELALTLLFTSSGLQKSMFFCFVCLFVCFLKGFRVVCCLNPHLGQIWTNPNVGLKITFKMLTQLQLLLSAVHFLITFLTQHLGWSIFDPNLGSNNPGFCVRSVVKKSKYRYFQIFFYKIKK